MGREVLKFSYGGHKVGGSIFIGESGFTLATYCVKYLHTVSLKRRRTCYSLCKPSKPNGRRGLVF